MRTLKLKHKNCKHIQGLHFTPGGKLLVVGGYETRGIEVAAVLDLATGETVSTAGFVAENFQFLSGQSRFALGCHAYARSELPKVVRWCDPSAAPADWQNVPVGVGWPTGTSAVCAWAVAVNPAMTRVLVSVGRQRFTGGPSPTWTHHLADCPLDPPGLAAVTEMEEQTLFLAFAPDGTRWAAVSERGRQYELGLYDRPGGPPLARIPSPVKGSCPGWPAFSPDGRFLAMVVARLTVHVFTADDLKPVAVLKGHTKQLNAFAFSPDGRRVLTGANDGTVRLWDAATGEPGPVFDWQLGQVTAVTFAPDGLTAAAGGKAGKVVIWDVDG